MAEKVVKLWLERARHIGGFPATIMKDAKAVAISFRRGLRDALIAV